MKVKFLKPLYPYEKGQIVDIPEHKYTQLVKSCSEPVKNTPENKEKSDAGETKEQNVGKTTKKKGTIPKKQNKAILENKNNK